MLNLKLYIMVKFVYKDWFRILYLIIGVVSFCTTAFFLSLENIQKPWYVFLFFVAVSLVIHGGFSAINNGFQNASVYIFGIVAFFIMLIITVISKSVDSVSFEWVFSFLFLFVQIYLFTTKAPDKEEIKKVV